MMIFAGRAISPSCFASARSPRPALARSWNRASIAPASRRADKGTFRSATARALHGNQWHFFERVPGSPRARFQIPKTVFDTEGAPRVAPSRGCATTAAWDASASVAGGAEGCFDGFSARTSALCAQIEEVVLTPIRPLSIDELLHLHSSQSAVLPSSVIASERIGLTSLDTRSSDVEAAIVDSDVVAPPSAANGVFSGLTDATTHLESSASRNGCRPKEERDCLRSNRESDNNATGGDSSLEESCGFDCDGQKLRRLSDSGPACSGGPAADSRGVVDARLERHDTVPPALSLQCGNRTRNENCLAAPDTAQANGPARQHASEAGQDGQVVDRNDRISFSPRRSAMRAKLLKSANWVRLEVPLRLAHRLHDFSRLPFVVVSEPHMFEVYQLYCSAFEYFTRVGEVKSLDEELAFTRNLRNIVGHHARVVSLMQQGVANLRTRYPDISLDNFLDRLFVTRIGNRVLSESHLFLHEPPPQTVWTSGSDGEEDLGDLSVGRAGLDAAAVVGSIHQHCRPEIVIRAVASQVQQVATYTYGNAPEVFLDGELNLSFPYVPEHLRFICFEILKNSIRATIEYQLNSGGSLDRLPPVVVGVYKGAAHVVVKVSDQGGGLSPTLHEDIWKYGFSTASSPCNSSDAAAGERVTECSGRRGQGDSTAACKVDMAGYGFGLPLSRLYARYFGGDLDIKFMEGYGTDTYVLLPRLGDQRESEAMLNNTTFRSGREVSSAMHG